MTSLVDILGDSSKRDAVVDACVGVIDAEVADKGGLSGMAIKTGYKVVQNIKPGFVKAVVRDLLPEFAKALDPLFQEGAAKGVSTKAHFEGNASRFADALLAITDAKAARSTNGAIKGTYDKLRGMAKKNVEAAAPRLGALIDQFAK